MENDAACFPRNEISASSGSREGVQSANDDVEHSGNIAETLIAYFQYFERLCATASFYNLLIEHISSNPPCLVTCKDRNDSNSMLLFSATSPLRLPNTSQTIQPAQNPGLFVLNHQIDATDLVIEPFFPDSNANDGVNHEDNCIDTVKRREGNDARVTSKNKNTSSHITSRKTQDTKGRYKCTYCNKGFLYLCQMKVHARVHTGEKPFCCQFCSRRFRQSGSLSVHMRRHTGAEPYQCLTCGRKFRHINSLTRHKKQTHEK